MCVLHKNSVFDHFKFVVIFSAHVCRLCSLIWYLVFPQWERKVSSILVDVLCFLFCDCVFHFQATVQYLSKQLFIIIYLKQIKKLLSATAAADQRRHCAHQAKLKVLGRWLRTRSSFSLGVLAAASCPGPVRFGPVRPSQASPLLHCTPHSGSRGM